MRCCNGKCEDGGMMDDDLSQSGMRRQAAEWDGIVVWREACLAAN